MYAAKPWHPELAMVDMRVLFQVNSASSYEQYWSAHRHIHSKIRNRLEPASTEKLVYVYSNSKMVAGLEVAWRGSAPSPGAESPAPASAP